MGEVIRMEGFGGGAELERGQRLMAGDDALLLALSHPGIAAAEEDRRDDGRHVAWSVPARRVEPRGAADATIVRDLLLTLEFLYDSGFVAPEIGRGDVRLKPDGRPVIAPFALVVARAAGELPYATLLQDLLGGSLPPAAFGPSSFDAWFGHLARRLPPAERGFSAYGTGRRAADVFERSVWIAGPTPSVRRRARRVLASFMEGADPEAIALRMADVDGAERARDLGELRLETIEDLDDALRLPLLEPAVRQEILFQLGRRLLDAGRVIEAVEALEEAARLAPVTVRLGLALAQAQADAMSFPEALQTLAALDGHGLTTDETCERAIHAAEIHWRGGDPDRAQGSIAAGLAAASSDDQRARLLSLEAVIAAESGKSGEALRLSSEASALGGTSPAVRARVLQRRGRAAKIAGDIRAALASYEEAERILRQASDPRGAAGVMVDVASCVRILGRGDEALTMYRAAQEAAEAAGNTEAATLARFNRDTLLAERGEWQDSLERFLHAARVDQELGHPSYLAHDRYWLGLVSSWMGEEAAARQHLSDSERGLLASGEVASAAQAALAIAELAMRRRDYAEAAKALGRVPDRETAGDETAVDRAALGVLLGVARDGAAPQGLVARLDRWAASAVSTGDPLPLAFRAAARAASRESPAESRAILERAFEAIAGQSLHGEVVLAEQALRIGLDGPPGDGWRARVEGIVRRLDAAGAPAAAPGLRDAIRTRADDEPAALLRAFRAVEVLLDDADPRRAIERLLEQIAGETRSETAALFLASGRGALRVVARHGEGDLAAIAERVRQIGGELPDATGRSLGACLRRRGDIVGVVVARRDGGKPPYAETHRRFLEALAGHAPAFLAQHLRALLASDADPGEELAPGLVGGSDVTRELGRRLAAIAAKDVAVLILGESGTGKEVVGRAIHRLSRRRDRRFTAINMGALPESLAMAELQGARRGAFSGAVADRAGLLEESSGGTVFMDEIGDVPLQAQVQLNRILQEGEVRRLGENLARKIDVRFLFATHKDLARGVKDGWFREDLFYRVNVVSISIPPLRERPDDVPVLARHLVARIARRLGLEEPSIGPSAMAALCAYPWPGNVRQLENVLTRAIVELPGDEIGAGDLPSEIRARSETQSPVSLRSATERFERDYIASVLARCKDNRSQAARTLGLSRQGLLGKMKALGLMKGKKE
ncbi:MAG: sigma-54 dependent transcriptional regulator [Acidobacteriota bacterium]